MLKMQCKENSMYNAATKQLNLTQQHLETVPVKIIDEYSSCTEYLDLSRNRLSNLNWIYLFENLKYLILDGNRLHEAHFQQLKNPLENIKVLMLNKNDFSDLDATVRLLSFIFPHLEYLSLHGNPICPDGLELMPFCQYINYDYSHYRSTIVNAFSKLKFLDHCSIHACSNHVHDIAQDQARILTFTPKMLWTKMKSLLPNKVLHPLPNCDNPEVGYHCGTIRKLTNKDYVYKGNNSEGNRFISNNDL